MPFVTPQFSKNQVNRAGEILCRPNDFPLADHAWASAVLTNWRACHGYPINTFQATLRAKLKNGYRKAIVAQRLKRTPSILLKLQRFEGMRLARMQDIGGLRAILSSLSQVRRLEKDYKATTFEHELTNSKDYIADPKEDGYRGIHLIYRYRNKRAPAYNGISLELQLRTHRQHAWATAVETMGTFLGQALKAGQGDQEWRDFFAKASAAIAILEDSTAGQAYEELSREQIFESLAAAEARLGVLKKLQGFVIATNKITAEPGSGAYHLITLDSERRIVTIRPYGRLNLAQANEDYAAVERRTEAGEPIEAVLVSAGPVAALRSAFPNYFLDTHAFVREMNDVIAEVNGVPARHRIPRRSQARR